MSCCRLAWGSLRYLGGLLHAVFGVGRVAKQWHAALSYAHPGHTYMHDMVDGVTTHSHK